MWMIMVLKEPTVTELIPGWLYLLTWHIHEPVSPDTHCHEEGHARDGLTTDTHDFYVFIFICLFSFCVYESFVCIYVKVPHVCSACGGQKRALHPLHLELRWLWATRWVLGTELWLSGRAASSLNCWASTPASLDSFSENHFPQYLFMCLLKCWG